MQFILCVMIVLSLLLQPSARAEVQSEANPGENIGGALIVGAGLGLIFFALYKPISYVVSHDDELSDSRKHKYALLEVGKANEYGHSFAVGPFINENQLLLGRFSQHLSPNRNIDFKSFEFGYRHYAGVLFAEVGLFIARHHQAQDFYQLSRISPRYRFDTYETKGSFISVGAAAMFWRASFGLRGTIHRGFSTDTIQTYENVIDPGDESRKESRDQYKLRGTGYLDLSFAI